MVKIGTSKKIEEKKDVKEKNLLTSAFELFTEKGFKETSIQEIVDNAGVAKGTFYLYFKDKYEIQNKLISKKSRELFNSALNYVSKKNIDDNKERIIALIDYIIDRFNRDKLLLKFISKNLSMGIFNDKVNTVLKETENDLLDLFKKNIASCNSKIENPEVTLFMIIELTSSTVYNSIVYNKPLPIKEYKPYLYDEIRKMLSWYFSFYLL